MNNTRLLAAMIAMTVLAACGDEPEPFKPPRPLNVDEQALVTSSNEFGFRLFDEVVTQTPDQNVFVSPLSVSMALGMTLNGARGTTAAGMTETLSFASLSMEQINQAYLSLSQLLTTMDPEVTVEIANSVWYRQGLSLLQTFIDACTQYFTATVAALDFASPQAVDAINAWVQRATHDKIDSIVERINADSMMYLINAVYFLGDWTTQFDAKKTVDTTFHGQHGDTQVRMMSRHGKVGMFTTSDFKAAHLPYGHELFGMTIILPNQGVSVDAVAAQLSSTSWQEWLGTMQQVDIDVGLPRFELEYEASLNDVLAALGMAEAFTPAADFSGMTDNAALFIAEVKHKTFVRVDEQGTEAAAVTSVEMRETATGEVFHVDRPFIFVIHDLHSQSMLFMGRIQDL